MALYLRGKTWWVDLMTPDGRRTRESAETESKTQAQKYHDKRKREIYDEHKLGVKPSRPFAEAVTALLAEKKSRKSVDDYRRQLQWWQEQFVGLSVKDITQEMIVEKIEAKRERDGIADATSNRYLSALRVCLRLVKRKYQWIATVPEFFFYEEDNERERTLSQPEIARLLAGLPEWVREMFLFSLATGLRKSNVMHLSWDQVSLQSKTLTINRRLMKGKKTLIVPLSHEALEVLRRQIGRHPEAVFIGPAGDAAKGVHSYIWKAALEQAGLTDVRWHDLRHTWATLLRQKRVPLDALQKLGGWETPRMVERYAKYDPESVREYVAGTDEVVRDATSQMRHNGLQPVLRVVG